MAFTTLDACSGSPDRERRQALAQVLEVETSEESADRHVAADAGEASK
jgi:hypothetical protein